MFEWSSCAFIEELRKYAFFPHRDFLQGYYTTQKMNSNVKFVISISMLCFNLLPQTCGEPDEYIEGLRPADVVVVTGTGFERYEIIQATRAFRYKYFVQDRLLLRNNYEIPVRIICWPDGIDHRFRVQRGRIPFGCRFLHQYDKWYCCKYLLCQDIFFAQQNMNIYIWNDWWILMNFAWNNIMCEWMKGFFNT